VKYLSKTVLFLLLLLGFIIFFMPKTELYYKAETLLSQHKIILSGEIVKDHGFVFNVEGGKLFFDDLEIAELDGITVIPLLAYNRISFAPFAFSDNMKNFIPGQITQMNIQHSIINPLKVFYTVTGDFGDLNGTVVLAEQRILAELIPSKTLLKQKPVWLRQFKKQEGGVYRYESTY